MNATTASRAVLAALLLATFGCGGEDEGSSGNPGSPGPSKDPFAENVLTTFDLEMDPAEWSALTSDLFDNTWRNATVRWEGQTWADVAVHPAGQSSRQPEHRGKPSLWLSFKEFVAGRKFNGYDRVKLDAMADDPAMVRERLAYAVYAARGVPVPKAVHCKVNVNGTYLGLYLLEERINRDFVQRRFGQQTVNELYRWSSFQPDMIYDPGLPAAAYAGPIDQFPMWEARFETPDDDPESVKALMAQINTDPDNAAAQLDVDNFLNFMAAEVATGETDGYIGNNHTEPDVYYTGNIFLYKNPQSGRYLFMVWDRDQSFWRPEPPANLADASITHGFDRRIATKRLILDVPSNFAKYKQYLGQIADAQTHPDQLIPRLRALVDLIRDAAFADPNRIFAPTPQHLVWEWEGMERIMQSRWDTIREQLAAP